MMGLVFLERSIVRHSGVCRQSAQRPCGDPSPLSFLSFPVGKAAAAPKAITRSPRCVMDSKFGNRAMITILAIGFIICLAYSLSSSHLHKDAGSSSSGASEISTTQ
jgi:hypothetical protein